MPHINFYISLFIVISAIFIALVSRRLNLNINFYIKLFFYLVVATFICKIVTYFIPLPFIDVIGSFFMYSTFAFVLLHSSKILGNRKTAIFFTIALLFGLFSEAIGVKYGLIFGNYYYTLSTFFFGLVPLATPISWAIIIYFGYVLTNILLSGYGEEIHKKTDNLWYSIGLVLLLSLIGGLIAVNIDMILDPVSVTPPAIGWVWIGGGPYYGIPISNFIGWFLVAAVAILIFRSYELISSKSDSSELSVDSYYNFYIIPIYIMYFLFNAVRALELGRIEYVLIGATTMGPFILITILIFMLKMKKR